MQNIFLTKICFVVKISDNYMQFSKCPICGGKLNSQEQRNKAQIYKDSGYSELLQKYIILQEHYNDLKQGYDELRLKLRHHVATESEWRLKRANELQQLSQELMKKNREIIKLKEELKKAEAQMLYEARQFADSCKMDVTFQPRHEVTTSLLNEQSLTDDKPWQQ